MIKINRHELKYLTITLTDISYPNTVTYELWGDISDADYFAPFESHNDKHLKNRIGSNNRTIFFLDGTKITCVSALPTASVSGISIYYSANVHHINVSCDKLEYSASNAIIANRLDEVQADGKNSTYELTEKRLIFYNIYTEDIPGTKVEQRINLGELQVEYPRMVNDLYDDPRLDHT